jgi:hypothetical protein
MLALLYQELSVSNRAELVRVMGGSQGPVE